MYIHFNLNVGTMYMYSAINLFLQFAPPMHVHVGTLKHSKLKDRTLSHSVAYEYMYTL